MEKASRTVTGGRQGGVPREAAVTGNSAERPPTRAGFLPRPFTNRATRVLCRSQHFALCSEYEYVWVEGEGLEKPVGLASFYGSPSEAAISPDEKWCVIGGYGFVVQRLRSPWWQFVPTRGEPDDPWRWEMGRDPEGHIGVAHVRASVEGHTFVLSSGPNDYLLDADMPLSLRVIRGPVDYGLKKRTEIMGTLKGLRLSQVKAEKDGLLLCFGDHGAYRINLMDTCSIEIRHPGGVRGFFARNEPPLVDCLITTIGESVRKAYAQPDGSLTLEIDLPKTLPRSVVVSETRASNEYSEKQLSFPFAADSLKLPAALRHIPAPSSGFRSSSFPPYCYLHVAGNIPARSWSVETPGGEVVSPGYGGWAGRS